jgi:hypothetical protein
LETELARLERELVAARLREEIALVLPARPARTVPKKKNQRRR